MFMHMGVNLSCVAFEKQSNLGLDHRQAYCFSLVYLGQLIYLSFVWFSHLEDGHLALSLAHRQYLVENGFIK